MARIGSLNEGPLHAALKALYAEPGDRLEAPVDGYVVDILRADGIVEIQTGSFAKVARKLRALAPRHRLRLVHPVIGERRLVKLPRSGRGAPERRRSPKRGGFELVFEELVSFPDLLDHENFELEVVTILEEEVRRFEAARRRRRRRGWVVVERRLLGVQGRRVLRGGSDLLGLLPPGLPQPFGTAELAAAFGRPRGFAQKVAYCLRRAGVAKMVGKRGNALQYELAPPRRPRSRRRRGAGRSGSVRTHVRPRG